MGSEPCSDPYKEGSPPQTGGVILHFFRQSTWRCSNSPRKKSREFPRLRMFFGVGYGCFCWQSTGGCSNSPRKKCESFLLSKNVCWCWLRMLLLAEYVPATMLDPQALGTAFQKKNKRSEWNCTSSPSLNNAADYKGGGVASPQASWIFGTARIMRARHGNIWHGWIHEIWHGTARDVPEFVYRT